MRILEACDPNIVHDPSSRKQMLNLIYRDVCFLYLGCNVSLMSNVVKSLS